MIFTFSNTAKFLVGNRALDNLPYELKINNLKKPLIVSDDISFRLDNVDLVKRALKLNEDVVEPVVYRKIVNVATTEKCEDIARLYRKNSCDCIIAVGRKALVEAVKGSKILIVEDISFMNHYDNFAISNFVTKDVPLFIIPTNTASGFEVRNNVRIRDEKENKVYEFNTDYASTYEVIIDPDMTDTIPQKAIVTATLYALAMSIEVFASKDAVPIISTTYASTALELIKDNWEKSIFKNSNVEYRTNIMQAVVVAGAAFDMLKKTAIEIMSDAISDRYKIDFRNVFAILFPHYLKKQQKGEKFGYALASLIDNDEYCMYSKQVRSQKVLDHIDSLYEKMYSYVDYYSKLSDIQTIKRDDLEEIADSIIANYTSKELSMSKEEILEILVESF